MKENLSEFLKFAYEHDSVRDLEEAFKEFPVEEEWHKGKIENVLKEDSAIYSIYEIGDIVYVKEYMYSNGEIGNNHLFVIIDQDNTAVPIESFGMLISSNLRKMKFSENKLLKKDIKNNLDKDSIVKTDVIYKILNQQILFKIGKVDEDRIEEYKISYYNNINKNWGIKTSIFYLTIIDKICKLLYNNYSTRKVVLNFIFYFFI